MPCDETCTADCGRCKGIQPGDAAWWGVNAVVVLRKTDGVEGLRFTVESDLEPNRTAVVDGRFIRPRVRDAVVYRACTCGHLFGSDECRAWHAARVDNMTEVPPREPR